MFFTFRQNNVQGYLQGPAHYVIIEANSESKYVHAYIIANTIAESILDFDDYCHCCGHRWYRTNALEGTEVPTVYGKEVYPQEIHPKYSCGYTATYNDEPVLIVYLSSTRVKVKP